MSSETELLGLDRIKPIFYSLLNFIKMWGTRLDSWGKKFLIVEVHENIRSMVVKYLYGRSSSVGSSPKPSLIPLEKVKSLKHRRENNQLSWEVVWPNI